MTAPAADTAESRRFPAPGLWGRSSQGSAAAPRRSPRGFPPGKRSRPSPRGSRRGPGREQRPQPGPRAAPPAAPRPRTHGYGSSAPAPPRSTTMAARPGRRHRGSAAPQEVASEGRGGGERSGGESRWGHGGCGAGQPRIPELGGSRSSVAAVPLNPPAGLLKGPRPAWLRSPSQPRGGAAVALPAGPAAAPRAIFACGRGGGPMGRRGGARRARKANGGVGRGQMGRGLCGEPIGSRGGAALGPAARPRGEEPPCGHRAHPGPAAARAPGGRGCYAASRRTASTG